VGLVSIKTGGIPRQRNRRRRVPADPKTTAELAEHIDRLIKKVKQGLAEVDVAETAIAEACQRHPEAADMIFHAFALLVPWHERMEHPAVYRAYCDELVERVATGGDTRTGTALEVCLGLMEVSKTAPLRSSAMGACTTACGSSPALASYST
jgi:phosphoribosyl-ATP pyrophosphohydrolase